MIAPLFAVGYEVYHQCVLSVMHLPLFNEKPKSALIIAEGTGNIGRWLAYGLAIGMTGWGAWDCLAGSRPCDHLCLQFRYGIPLIRHPVESLPQIPLWQQPAMLSIFLSCLMWLIISVMIGRYRGSWQPLWLIVFVLLLFGALPPSKPQSAETVWNFIRWIAGNGIEVVYMLAIWRCLKLSFP
jgi:hypothetical protein